MIRSEHSIVEYDFQNRIVVPDRLRRASDADYVQAAEQLLRIYRGGIGRPRQDLHRSVETCLSQLGACPPRRIAAFCKLLDDQSEYDSKRRTAFELRRKLFDAAADFHPIVQHREGIFEHELHDVRMRVAESIGRPWSEIEADLFADVLELQRLKSFDRELSALDLLSCYNLAQTQAALYKATRIRVDATEDLKTIIKHAKLAGLMHRIDIDNHQGTRRFRFLFDGPQASLRESTRYGARFAALVPKLLSCRGWKLTAEVVGPRGQRFLMRLSPGDGVRSPLAAPEDFDSSLESEIDAAWHAAPVDGWQWRRESELLMIGQTVMTPDFTLTHQQRDLLVYVEVVGYWTPEYLQEKRQRLQRFTTSKITSTASETTVKWLLIVADRLKPEQQRQLADLQIPIVCFDKKSKPSDWIDALELESAE